MAPAEWNQIFELFHTAREKSGGERVLWLDTACGENTPLRKAVEELLREDEAASGFLSEPLLVSRTRERPGIRIVSGQKFGRYTIVALIGRGGMGEVWSAHDPDLDRPIALKFLYSEALAALDAHQIVREARAASALNHPGIVTIHEVVQSESTLAIAMELVEGTSLRELCGKPLPIAEALSIGQQISEALAAAHVHGTIHGDIKPENILLRSDRYVKVLDFGLARKVTAETLASGGIPALGTLRYMSPEQARGQPLTSASDIFSFGLVLYELATGRHAFPAASALDAAQAILENEAPAPSSVNPALPARLDPLIGAMLSKSPAQRPPAGQIAKSLKELQEAEKTFSRSFSVWKWIVAALLLTSACVVVWRWRQIRGARNVPTFRQVTTLVPENRATAAAISPDGKFAAYANVDGIFIRTIETGHTRALPAPGNYVVDRLAWFSDGTKLLASGFSALTHLPGIWMIPVNGTAPRLLREHARKASPSPDGTRVLFMSQDRSEIWVMGATGESPRRVAGGPEDRFELAFWSPDGRRISSVWDEYSVASEGWGYESIVAATGKVTANIPNSWMSSAAALPDGRIMFLRWDNDDFTSSRALWEVRTDPATGMFLGKARKVAALPGDDTTLLDLSVARDGKQAMVLRRSNQLPVFVGDFAQPPPRITNIRRLTLDERSNFPHAWTADSRAVIFESNRNGNFDLFKQYIDRRTPEAIVATPSTEILAQRSPDGRFVLYAGRPPENQFGWYYKPGTYTLMRVPVEGGTPEKVPIGGPLDEFRCALGAGKRCVLRTTQPGKYHTYYDLDPLRGKGRELARTKFSDEVLGDWDVSPDGTQVAIPNHDSRDAYIRVVSLEPKPNESPERKVVLKGLADLSGLVWAADGQGWFVSVNTTVGNRMLYVYLDGRFDPLGDIQGWAVPSPDGRKVAFLDRIVATNAWLMERH